MSLQTDDSLAPKPPDTSLNTTAVAPFRVTRPPGQFPVSGRLPGGIATHGQIPLDEPPPHAQSRAMVMAPKSQNDWEAKKEIIRRFYIDDNLPLYQIRALMTWNHAFYATERMYKRQFVKWAWKKYKPKGSSREDDKRPAKATCRRPPRRIFPTEHDVILRVRDLRNSTLPVILNHASDVDQRKHELFVNLRDLIYGTARQDPEWRVRGKFEPYLTNGHHVSDVFEVAQGLFKTRDLQGAMMAFRQGFRLLDEVVDDEPIELFQALFFYAPHFLPTNELLKAYLHHLHQLLVLKRPREPITLMAGAMDRFSVLEFPHLFATIKEMQRLNSSLYSQVRGEDDVHSLEARLKALRLDEAGGTSSREDYDGILRALEMVLASAVGQFGEFSVQALNVEKVWMGTVSRLPPLSHRTMECYERYLARVRTATGSTPVGADEWSYDILEGYRIVKLYVSDFLVQSGDVNSGIVALKEAIAAKECAVLKVVDERHRLEDARDVLAHRRELLQLLEDCGRTGEEADEVRALIAESEWMEEVVQNDVKENFSELLAS